MDVDWVVVWRLVNAIGCAVALTFLASAASKQWGQWNNKTQQHWWALCGWLLLGCEGAIENIIFGLQAGPRTVLQSLVVLFTLRALTIKEKLVADPAFPEKKEA